MANTISLLEAIDEIRSGVPFSVTFTKRTTGSVRHMVAVKKVKRGRKRALRYSFRSKNLIPVFDLQSSSYRTVPIDRLIEVNGKTVER